MQDRQSKKAEFWQMQGIWVSPLNASHFSMNRIPSETTKSKYFFHREQISKMLDKKHVRNYNVTVLYNSVTERRLMDPSNISTLEKIHSAAKTEFLEKGYQRASLRNIVKNAGVTTGAFYGYYNSKKELFAALVDAPYHYLLSKYQQSLRSFEKLPPEKQPERMGSVGKECMQEMLIYMNRHKEIFHLILLCSEGTQYAALIDKLVTLEVEATEHYCEVLRSLGKTVPEIDKRLEHILVTGMMNAYFEIILHNMSREDAKRYLCELNDFYTAGWLKIMGQ